MIAMGNRNDRPIPGAGIHRSRLDAIAAADSPGEVHQLEAGALEAVIVFIAKAGNWRDVNAGVRRGAELAAAATQRIAELCRHDSAQSSAGTTSIDTAAGG